MIGANIHLNLAKIIFSVIFIMLPSSTITRSMISSNAFNESTSTLNGKHLVVSGISSIAGFNLIRNATGHIIRTSGMASQMLMWLSERYNFTYSVLQVNDTALDFQSENRPGLINYLVKGDSQLLISLAPTYSRSLLVDFSNPTVYVPVSYLIPKPDKSVNLGSITNSFQNAVWVALLISILGITLAFALFRRYYKISCICEGLKQDKKRGNNVYSYVWEVILSQGGHLHFQSMPFYLVGGVWCIATFVLVNAYNSTLISYVTLPSQKPLINSIYDLKNRPDVNLVTDRNLNTDEVLSAAESGFLKLLGDKLRSYPKSRCNSSKECIRLVKSGSHVYSSGLNSFLYGAMKEDYRETGSCNLQLQRESYMDLEISWAVRKGSPYMKTLNIGFMHMREAGLVNQWNKKYQPDARECLVKDKKQRNPQKLTVGNFTGAFVLLGVGYLLSALVFFGERILFPRCHKAK